MYKLAINRPITTLMFFIALVFFGAMSLLRMPVNLFPEVVIPLIKITTYAPGDMSLIESRITKKIEDEVSTIDGIKKIRSYTFNNLSIVTVEFNLKKNIDVAANDVRDKVAKAKLDAQPEIEKISSDSGKVASFFVSRKDENLTALMQTVKDEAKPFLQRVKGVGKVDDKGFLEPEIKIYLDPFKLDKYALTAASVINIIKSQNLKAPLGKLENSKFEIFLKSEFDAKSVQELEEIRLQKDVFLKDVARIELSHHDTDAVAMYNGKRGVLLDAIKVSGANTIETIDALKAKTDDLAARLGENYEVERVYEKSESILKHINQVKFDMMLGVALTVVIVFFFLRSFSATIIAALAIPASIVGTFFIIDVLGFDLNRLTLLALTLGIGIFIDDAIVVVENISKKMQEGESNPLKASFEGVREIAFSVLSISAVLLCVFVPIAFMEGIIGQYFNSFGMSVSGGIVVSFLVCIMLIPSLAARFLSEGESKFYRVTEPFFEALESGYERLLKLILRFKTAFVILTLGVLALCMSLAGKVGMDFLPVEDEGQFEIFLKASPGISVEAMSARASEVVREVDSDPRVEYSYMIAGYTDSKDAYKAKIYVRLKGFESRKERQTQIMDEYRKKLKFDDLSVKVLQIPYVDTGSDSEPVQLTITGDSLEKLDEILPKAIAMVRAIEGTTDVGSDNEDKINELQISVNKDKAKRLSVDPSAVAQVIYASFGQNRLGSFDNGDAQYDMILRFDDEYRKDVQALQKLKIKNAHGESISLSAVAEFKTSKTFSVINRFNKQRQIRIVANVDNVPLGAVQKGIDENIGQILPVGYDYVMTGFIEMMNDTNAAFVFTISLSVVLIYMILAALYESFILPLIIMISMPLAFGGVAVGLYLSGNSFSLFVMVGAILLFGMVGKNAILVVDFANRYANEGVELNEAIVRAGVKRLRAILMTTFAMIFAMLPLALSRGAGYEGNSPMAISVISGLISSTLLTLLVVPALFGAVYKIDKFVSKIYKREEI